MRLTNLCIFINLLLPLCSLAQNQVHDWLIVYYMPYDNDLSNFKQPILNQFNDLRLKGNICITFQVDQANDKGLTRHIINSEWDSLQLAEERSASAEVFEDYLLWSATRFKARHYAVILLSHGGLSNEYGVDMFPETQWLRIESLARAIRKFNKAAGVSKIDLVFEQVCSRATIENFYEFADVARFTLASQSLVPLPNYYYAQTMKWLDEGNVSSGKQLADAIVENERADMYYSYTLVNNNEWERWMLLWAEYNQLIQGKKIEIKKDSLLSTSFSYSTDSYFDLKGFVNAIRINGKLPNEAKRFLNFTFNHLCEEYYANPNSDKMKGYSGVSVLSPFVSNDKELALQSTEAYLMFRYTMNRLKK